MIGVEHLEEDSDGKALLKVPRSAGLMSAFSGAGGRVYMEYRRRLCPLFLCIFVICHIQPLLLLDANHLGPVLPTLGRERVLRRNPRTHQRGIICLRNAISRRPAKLCSLLYFAENDVVHGNLLVWHENADRFNTEAWSCKAVTFC